LLKPCNHFTSLEFQSRVILLKRYFFSLSLTKHSKTDKNLSYKWFALCQRKHCIYQINVCCKFCKHLKMHKNCSWSTLLVIGLETIFVFVQTSDAVESITIETETSLKLRDRDFIKNLETWAFCPNFVLNVVITSELNFFYFWLFPTCFGCFLPANATNKNRWILEILLNYFFATFKVVRPVAFETQTRKYGSRDSITGSDINAHCIYYREYCFPHCMLGSDGVSRCGLGLETLHFSSLSLEGLRSCLGLQRYGLGKLL